LDHVWIATPHTRPAMTAKTLAVDCRDKRGNDEERARPSRPELFRAFTKK
jgi:hypothetical protein